MERKEELQLLGARKYFSQVTSLYYIYFSCWPLCWVKALNYILSSYLSNCIVLISELEAYICLILSLLTSCSQNQLSAQLVPCMVSTLQSTLLSSTLTASRLGTAIIKQLHGISVFDILSGFEQISICMCSCCTKLRYLSAFETYFIPKHKGYKNCREIRRIFSRTWRIPFIPLIIATQAECFNEFQRIRAVYGFFLAHTVWIWLGEGENSMGSSFRFCLEY